MKRLFGNNALVKMMKRLRTIVLYAAAFYQVLEIFSLYGFVKISRTHPLFFISNFSSFHLVSIIILFNEYKKHVLHLNLFIVINTIWLLVIAWNIVYITTIGEHSVAQTEMPAPNLLILPLPPSYSLFTLSPPSHFLRLRTRLFRFSAPKDIRHSFSKDPIQHVLLVSYVTCSAILELIVIIIRHQAVKGIEIDKN